ERTSSTLSAFRVQSDSGRLTHIGTYPTQTQPRDFAIAPSGRYLLAVGEQSDALSTYTIDNKTGVLQHCSQVAVGQNPTWVEVIDLPG
ncbi:MAG: beta-propeller fold lactonase family protein, partial [Hymenobacter sp.]|nr:beta-propeller fold lactonase family protein [Hymenobacter sp.]